MIEEKTGILANRIYNKYFYKRFNWVRGSTRIKGILEKWLEKIKYDMPKVIEVDHLNVTFAAPSTGGAIKLYSGVSSEPPLRFLWNSVEEGDKFVDVGAAYGLYSVVASQRNAEVISFEPNPVNISFLSMNKHVYGHDFEVIEKAISDNKGEIEFFAAKNFEDRGSIETGSNDDVPHGSYSKLKVKSTTIDEELAHIRQDIDFIKIDVEGAEGKVLEGGEKTLEDSKPVLLLEVHAETLLNKYDYSKSDIFDFMDSKGYSAYVYNSGDLKEFEGSSDNSNDNLVFIHDRS